MFLSSYRMYVWEWYSSGSSREAQMSRLTFQIDFQLSCGSFVLGTGLRANIWSLDIAASKDTEPQDKKN
jgi:hypothetical protein